MHAFTTSSRLSAQSVYAWVLDQYFWAHILLVHECSAVHTSTQCVHMRASFLGFHLSIKPRLDATRHIPFLFCLPIPLDLAQVALSCFTPAYTLFIPTSPTTKTHRHIMYTPGSQYHDQGSLLSLCYPHHSNPRNARPVTLTAVLGPILLPARQPPLGEFLLKLTLAINTNF